MSLPEKFRAWLQSSSDGWVLGLFRLMFGLMMLHEMVDYFQIDLVKNAFVLPQAHLGYDFLGWLQPLPEGAMKAMLGVMLLCSALIAAGLLFRPACFVFGTFYLYFLLLDKGIFNNHLYLFILLAFLLGFTHADRFLSVKNLLRPEKKTWQVQRWEVFVLQMQFAVVYFYGGLAKLNPDWLVRMEPMKGLVAKFPADHWLAPLVKHDFQVPLLTYGGAAFDLAMPFLLWWKPTRRWALIPLVFFHLANSQIFNDIGIFPFAMIFSAVLFFETSEVPFLKNLAVPTTVGNARKPKKSLALLASPGWMKKVLAGFFIFQLLFPLRGLLLPNPVDWTSVATNFSWRMKIQSREMEEFAFTIQDGEAGGKIPVEIQKFINPMQIMAVARDPRAAADTARTLADEARRQGMKDPQVRARIRVRWNGREPAFTVDPEADLSKVEHNPFEKMPWAMPEPK